MKPKKKFKTMYKNRKQIEKRLDELVLLQRPFSKKEEVEFEELKKIRDEK